MSLSPEFEIIDQSSDQEKSYETFIDMSIKLVLGQVHLLKTVSFE